MTDMCRLSLVLEPLSEDEQVISVVPTINGTKLTVLVEQFERAMHYEPAGGYAGLVPSHYNFGDIGDYFMGRDPNENFTRAGYWLLGCSCGEAGCWPLAADIVPSGATITWQNFSQPFRPERDYSTFGPFVFHMEEYSLAVAQMQTLLAAN
jgi:hypothetical protein